MKRIVFLAVAVILTATACGGANDSTAGRGSGSRTAPVSTNCVDAKLTTNLTPEDYAKANVLREQTIGIYHGDSDETLIQALLKNYGALVSATPPGGQGEYARAVCSAGVKNTYSRVDLQTGVLFPGYEICRNITQGVLSPDGEFSAEAKRDSPFEGEDRLAAEAAMRDAAKLATTHLCPQLK